jgi:hypothetical protein
METVLYFFESLLGTQTYPDRENITSDPGKHPGNHLGKRGRLSAVILCSTMITDVMKEAQRGKRTKVVTVLDEVYQVGFLKVVKFQQRYVKSHREAPPTPSYLPCDLSNAGARPAAPPRQSSTGAGRSLRRSTTLGSQRDDDLDGLNPPPTMA